MLLILEHFQKEQTLQEEIQQYLENEFTDGEINIQLDGNRIYIQVVSQAFEGMSRVKRQQRIYGCLKEYIQSGELHAVSISALTQGELSS